MSKRHLPATKDLATKELHAALPMREVWTEGQVRALSDYYLNRDVVELRHAVDLLCDHASATGDLMLEHLQHGLGLMEVELTRRGLAHPLLRAGA